MSIFYEGMNINNWIVQKYDLDKVDKDYKILNVKHLNMNEYPRLHSENSCIDS
jgi:hypothetical protein